MSNYEKWDRILKDFEENEEKDQEIEKAPKKPTNLAPMSHKPSQLKEEIREASEKIHTLERDITEYDALGNVLQDMPKKLDHSIMVPLGKQAFIPGKIIHSNEIIAHLGGEYYAKKTASETFEMVERKKKNINEQIEHQKKWLASLHEKLEDVDHVVQLKKIYQEANIQEIKETEEDSNLIVDASTYTQEDYDMYFEVEREEEKKLASSAWDWDEAMQRIEELEQHEDQSEDKIAIQVNEADRVKQQGNAAFASANYILAAELYTKAISLTPTAHTLYGNRSAAYFHLKRYPEAQQDAEKAISIDSKWAKGYFRLGQVLGAMGKFDLAADAYEEATKLKPNDKSSSALASQMRQAAEREKNMQKLSTRDQARSNVFTGTVVERGTTTTAQPSGHEEPPKRVSRFKSSRQKTSGM